MSNVRPHTMKLAVLFTAALFASSVAAQEEGVLALGAGTASCGKWIESRNDKAAHFQYKQWVLGFISGSNWNTVGPQSRPTDQEAVVAFVDLYCKNNPLHTLVAAAAVAVQETGGAKVKIQWKR